MMSVRPSKLTGVAEREIPAEFMVGLLKMFFWSDGTSVRTTEKKIDFAIDCGDSLDKKDPLGPDPTGKKK